MLKVCSSAKHWRLKYIGRKDDALCLFVPRELVLAGYRLPIRWQCSANLTIVRNVEWKPKIQVLGTMADGS